MTRAKNIAPPAAVTVPGTISGIFGKFAVAAPVVALFTIFFMVPILMMLSVSFERIDTTTYEVVEQLTLAQYFKFLTDPFYLDILFNTLWISAGTAAASLLFAYPVALHMSRSEGATRQIILIIVLSPLLISHAVLNFGWLIILNNNGLINSSLVGLGFIRAPTRLLHTEGAVIAGLMHSHLPFMVLPIENALRAVRPEVNRAAISLGASSFRLFRGVTLPLSARGIVTGTVIVFSLSASSFVVPAVLGGVRVKTMASVAFEEVTLNLNVPFAAAVSLILLVLTTTIVAALGWLGRRFQPPAAAQTARRKPLFGGAS